MKNYDLKEKLIKARQAKGWTQMDLAEKSKISLRTIQRIELGQVNPRAYTIKQLFEIIGLDFSEILENSGDSDSKIPHSSFRLSKNFLWRISDLFNLKTNTMKKVTILTIIFSAICAGIFISTFSVKAQKSNEFDLTKYTKMNSRGIIYFFPRGIRFSISNMKDTADYRFLSDLVQEYKNKIFLNNKYVGKALNSDTVIYSNGELVIRSSFWEFAPFYGRKIHYLIPKGIPINDFSVQIDTANIIVPGHHIREFDYQIYLDGEFQFKLQDNDTVIYSDGKIELLE